MPEKEYENTSVSSPEARQIFLLSIYGMPRRDTDWLDLGHVPIIIARQSWSHSQEPHEIHSEGNSLTSGGTCYQRMGGTMGEGMLGR